jgi:hypothetical protein
MTHDEDNAAFNPVVGTVCFHHNDPPQSWPHWNADLPGIWSSLVRPDEAGSYIAGFITSNCGGVYRLVGLANPGINVPAKIDRVCGSDETGTLYIGRASSQRSLQLRLGTLFRTLNARKGIVYSGHSAAEFLRHHPLLSARFPLDRVAVTWSYDYYDTMAEQILFARYVRSFGEAPPLNLQRGLV